ncbi:hypothetical protein [Sphaerospermopsis aphanizomenoides]|nr:hypothetical protein [Sphaerospermopsis aphanizomenoides]
MGIEFTCVVSCPQGVFYSLVDTFLLQQEIKESGDQEVRSKTLFLSRS